jgi:hypothetical protein
MRTPAPCNPHCSIAFASNRPVKRLPCILGKYCLLGNQKIKPAGAGLLLLMVSLALPDVAALGCLVGGLRRIDRGSRRGVGRYVPRLTSVWVYVTSGTVVVQISAVRCRLMVWLDVGSIPARIPLVRNIRSHTWAASHQQCQNHYLLHANSSVSASGAAVGAYCFRHFLIAETLSQPITIPSQ